MLLICVMVFQFVAPAVAAPVAASTTEHHMTMNHSDMAHPGAVELDHDMAAMDAHEHFSNNPWVKTSRSIPAKAAR